MPLVKKQWQECQNEVSWNHRERRWFPDPHNHHKGCCDRHSMVRGVLEKSRIWSVRPRKSVETLPSLCQGGALQLLGRYISCASWAFWCKMPSMWRGIYLYPLQYDSEVRNGYWEGYDIAHVKTWCMSHKALSTLATCLIRIQLYWWTRCWTIAAIHAAIPFLWF